ncbi:MAPEG family protein [Aliiglaciecola sp. LCG003]|uniref:MAPEG family protein n=1 Tax=Aliiglaciecola sp. LCG003 TaxID=3053655 RepID=UPI002572AB12|nr:MAPEG family protein [Aliiglaciecola sp. LCG003]WJG10855.1 MAPEG family protein [Aliiglaciecola sp. LCG003]
MTTILICLAIATIMPILFKAPLAVAMNQQGGYDNRHPRAQQSQLSGFGGRAKAVHENSFEALIMFTPGALAAIVTHQVGDIAQYLAITFIIARTIYAFCYWFNIHVLRSVVWLVGFICSIGLLVISI